MPIKAPGGMVVLPSELLAQEEIRSLCQDMVASEIALRDLLYFDDMYPQLHQRLATTLSEKWGLGLTTSVEYMRSRGWILYDSYFLYLTLHRSKVQPGTTQRLGGFHVDGLQSARYAKKFANTH